MERRNNIVLQLSMLLFLLRPVPSLHAQNWSQTGAPTLQWQAIACSSNGTRLAAADVGWATNSGGLIYCSTNSGLTWLSSSAPRTNWISVACSADGARLIAAANAFGLNGPFGQIGGGPIYVSTNGGLSWMLSSAPLLKWRKVVTSADGKRCLGVVYGGGVFTSTNSGVDWVQTSAASNSWVSAATSNDGIKLVAAVGSGGGIFTSGDSGASWSLSSAPNRNWDSVASSGDGSRLVATIVNGSIYSSTNGGLDWVSNSVPLMNYGPITSSADGAKLAVAIYWGPILSSFDSGKSWFSNDSPSKFWTAIASAADGSKVVASDMEGGIGFGSIYSYHELPLLGITLLHPNATISWSAMSSTEGFVLERMLGSSSANWTTLTNVPVIVRERYQVVVPASIGAEYFRLRGP